MTFRVTAERTKLAAAIRRHGKPGGDAWLQHYVGSPVPVRGMSVPQMRANVAAFRKEHTDITAKELNALAAALRKGASFEEKTLAVSLLEAYPRILDAASWRLLDRWVDDSVGWGMCDSIGAGPIATMVHGDPAKFREILAWTKSPNPWRRRVALYALRDYVVAKELDKPFRLIERLLYDEELWVQRAVGTWLRECWKRDRRRTEAFLRAHARGLPRVVITVATERAPKAFRTELRARRQGSSTQSA